MTGLSAGINPGSFRRLPVRVLAAAGGLAALGAATALLGNVVLAPLLGLALVAALLSYPEIGFALFLTAGSYKEWLAAYLPVPFDVTVALAALLGVAVLLRAGRGGPAPIPAALLLGTGLLALTVGLSALGTDADAGADKAARFVGLTVGSALAAAALLDSEQRVGRFLVACVLLGLAMTLTGRVTSEGMVAMNANHIATGRLLGLGIIGVAWLAARPGTKPLSRFALLLPGAALGYGFLYSGSRGAFTALVAAFAITAVTALRLRRARRLVLTAATILALVTAAASVLVPESLAMMNRRLGQVDARSDSPAGARLSLARDAWDVFTARPLSGAGVGGFGPAARAAEAGRSIYPHNILLEIAAELGLPGIAAFLLLVWLAAGRIRRALTTAGDQRRTALVLVVLAIAGYSLANAMFSGDLNDNRMLFAALGLCFALPRAAGFGAGRR